MLAGDIHSNPGPNSGREKSKFFSQLLVTFLDFDPFCSGLDPVSLKGSDKRSVVISLHSIQMMPNLL